MAADMFSGWGIRTLSSSSPGVQPDELPQRLGLAARQRDRRRRPEALRVRRRDRRIAAGLFDVATGARDFRLPELFCGFHRTDRAAIVAYPVACIPQAWAATAPFMLLQAMLGISAHAPGTRAAVDRPVLPDWLGSRWRFERHAASARLKREPRVSPDGPSTGFSLLEQQGNVPSR